MVGSGIRLGLLEVAVTVRVCVSDGPAEMPDRLTVCWPASSRIAAGLLIGLSVGASLTGVTVTLKVRENEASSVLLGIPSGPASRTVTVMAAVPLRLATGAYV